MDLVNAVSGSTVRSDFMGRVYHEEFRCPLHHQFKYLPDIERWNASALHDVECEIYAQRVPVGARRPPLTEAQINKAAVTFEEMTGLYSEYDI